MTAVNFVARVVEALERLGIAYMVVGSFSSNVYGRPRSTKDADFVIELGQQTIERLAQEVGPEFQLEPQGSFETITGSTRYELRHRGTAFVVEFFLLGNDPFARERFARRVRGVIQGTRVFIPTAEDVVVQKLRWSVHPGRRQDLEDARNVIAIQLGAIDLDYIRRWCDKHGTRSLFEQLLVESRRFEQEQP